VTQNIYDDPDFHAQYSGLARSVHGLEGAPEWPTLQELLPPLAGADVVDLGCGFGWFCRWAREHGAAQVLGIDVSELMLARARAETADPGIRYRHDDLDRITLAADTFDLAYSSLALHYVADLDRLLGEVAASLRPGGMLVASVEHPLLLGPRRPGWTDDDAPSWRVDSYLDESVRDTEWLGSRVIKHHRTIETYLRGLRQAGLVLTDLVEWGVTSDWVADNPTQAHDRHRPYFLLLAATRPGSEVEVGR